MTPVQFETAWLARPAISSLRSMGERSSLARIRGGTVNLVVLLIILFILFGGGGYYVGGPAIGGGLGGLILIVLVVLLLTGRL